MHNFPKCLLSNSYCNKILCTLRNTKHFFDGILKIPKIVKVNSLHHYDQISHIFFIWKITFSLLVTLNFFSILLHLLRFSGPIFKFWANKLTSCWWHMSAFLKYEIKSFEMTWLLEKLFDLKINVLNSSQDQRGLCMHKKICRLLFNGLDFFATIHSNLTEGERRIDLLWGNHLRMYFFAMQVENFRYRLIKPASGFINLYISSSKFFISTVRGNLCAGRLITAPISHTLHPEFNREFERTISHFQSHSPVHRRSD